MNKETIGTYLKTKRLNIGLTQQQLATQSGLSVSLISKLEIDDKEPTIGTLLKLTKVLNLNLTEMSEKFPNINQILSVDNYNLYIAEKENSIPNPQLNNDEFLELQGKLNLLILENNYLKETIKNQEKIIDLQKQLIEQQSTSINKVITSFDNMKPKEGE